MPAFVPASAVDLTGALGKFGSPNMNNYNPNMLAMMMGTSSLQNSFTPLMSQTSYNMSQVPAMTQLNPQQPPYYPQQTVYMNNNGQAVYYRPGKRNIY
jgi:hypothetical protein